MNATTTTYALITQHGTIYRRGFASTYSAEQSARTVNDPHVRLYVVSDDRADALLAALAEARNDAEREAMLQHATQPGECDAEYCPWLGYRESHCIRDQEHDINCRCPDCCEAYD